MSEIRFCYNPENKIYYKCYSSHSETLFNKGQQKNFNKFIRGIIINNSLYLRVYYPYNDIDNFTSLQIKQASLKILICEIEILKKIILENESILIKDIIFNTENDLLKNLNLANI